MLGMGLVFALPVWAQQPVPASAKKPLNQVQVVTLLAGQAPSHRVAMLVKLRGIDFEPQDDYHGPQERPGDEARDR
jgi:hypothetical protein